jgi:hypothetical protein
MSSDRVTYEPVPWPEAQEDIENYVLQAMHTTACHVGMNLYGLTGDPVQNRQDHFDFTLPTRGGNQFLDLMEVAPLRSVAGSYSNAPTSYVVGEMADAVWDEIRKKSEHYGNTSRTQIHLIVYPTDWRFQLGNEVTDLLAYWSLCRKHCFASIIYFALDDTTSGEIVRIYPRPSDVFSVFDEAAARGLQVALADLSADRFIPSGSDNVTRRSTGKSSAPLVFIRCASLTVPSKATR